MKFALTLLTLISFSVHASPVMTMKERLRIHMWVYGINDRQPVKEVKGQKGRRLPEEIERAIRKI